MPTYAYACRYCGHDFEVVQSFTDDSLTICPVCHGQLRKVFSNVGVVFKGSGFYRNDSRSPDTSAGDKGSSDKSSSDKGSAEKSGTDAKPADAPKKPAEKAASTPKPSTSSSSGSGSAA